MWANLILAWVAVGFGILCSVIWLLRLIHKKWYRGQKNALYRTNRLLRRPHKWLGIAMAVTAGLHGILSTDPLIGWNLGTLCWGLCILLGLTYLFRRKFQHSSWMVWHRVLTIAVVCAVAVHVIHTGVQIDDILRDGGGAAVPEGIDLNQMIEEYNEAGPSSTAKMQVQDPVSPDAAWNDGVYTGEGAGLRPGLRVQVTIQDGMIAAIEVIEHHEQDERFWGLPVRLIPQWIVDAQSIDVDTVSGATMTSRGIIEAVENALAQAAV
jgi:uncharacterized protein with FMN-binding domain